MQSFLQIEDDGVMKLESVAKVIDVYTINTRAYWPWFGQLPVLSFQSVLYLCQVILKLWFARK